VNKIVATHVSKRYDTVEALDDFSFAVGDGEIVALLGPDGAGKTTLMRILCNLIDPEPNEATQLMVNDVDVASSFDDVKAEIGYMPQTFSLYPDLSVEENMTFFSGIYGFTGKKYRDLRDRMYAFSNLGPFASRRAGALSGGMKQKLALSCALMHEPSVLILDEPTTGVDPLSRRQFWEMLLQLRDQGVTILVATPYMDEVARTDRAVCMLDGKRLTEAAPADLARQFEGTIYELDQEPTRDLILRLNDIEGLTARRFGSGAHVYVGDGETVDSYTEAMREAGADLDRLKKIDPSIEDRFMQLMEKA